MDIGRQEIDLWHRQRGWNGVGYHFIIRRNGSLEGGRNLEEAGAHCRGHNKDSIGICLVGGIQDGTKNKPVNNYTDEQWEALKKLVLELKEKYPGAKIVGHCDYEPKKTCPNFDVKEWVKNNIN